MDRPVFGDRGHHRASMSITVFTEGQRMGIPRICVKLSFTRFMIMSEKYVVQAGILDLRGLERSVRLLVFTFCFEPARFRTVK